MIASAWPASLAQADAAVGAGMATALLFALLMRWELKALAENVEVGFDDAVEHLAVEQKAVFKNAITLVVNFNSHNEVKVEVVRLLHTLYAAIFHQVVFTGQQRPEGMDPHVKWLVLSISIHSPIWLQPAAAVCKKRGAYGERMCQFLKDQLRGAMDILSSVLGLCNGGVPRVIHWRLPLPGR